MDSIKVMINGLPGNVASIIAKNLVQDNRFSLIPHSLTGPGIELASVDVGGVEVALALPETHRETLEKIKQEHGSFIIVDYCHPTAVNPNAELYCDLGIPFVMGTTGGDREALAKTVEASQIPAVIAPNMAKQIVGFQAMMEYAANTFPGLFDGFNLTIKESHQQGKADTSGTAKAMVGYFNNMGVPFETGQIEQVRDPKQQVEEMEIPEEYLGGHGWHTYTLLSEDKTVKFAFTHNINGREVYWPGTADALVYLSEKISQGEQGRVFSMIDALKKV